MASAFAPGAKVSKRSETPSWTPSGSWRIACSATWLGRSATRAADRDRLAEVGEHVIDAAHGRRHEHERAEAQDEPAGQVPERRLPYDRDHVHELHERVQFRCHGRTPFERAEQPLVHAGAGA